jgi:hypothetical protein
VINRKSISIVFAELNLKFYLLDKFGCQTIIKIEVALVEPPLFKAPQNAVIFTGSAHPNEGERGQLKRCTYIREAYFKPPQTPLYYYNLWTVNLSHGFLFWS